MAKFRQAHVLMILRQRPEGIGARAVSNLTPDATLRGTQEVLKALKKKGYATLVGRDWMPTDKKGVPRSIQGCKPGSLAALELGRKPKPKPVHRPPKPKTALEQCWGFGCISRVDGAHRED